MFHVTAGHFEAYGSASVRASGSASVEAYGSASVEAYGSASVRAYGSASVEAYGSASVKAYGSASVEAYGSASVKAYGSASVKAYGSASVKAYDSASVKAYDSASVEATPFAAIQRGPNHRGPVTGGVVIQLPDTSECDVDVWCSYYGIKITDGTMVVYKAVDQDLKSGYADTSYPIGETVTAEDYQETRRCGNGLHFGPTPRRAAANAVGSWPVTWPAGSRSVKRSRWATRSRRRRVRSCTRWTRPVTGSTSCPLSRRDEGLASPPLGSGVRPYSARTWSLAVRVRSPVHDPGRARRRLRLPGRPGRPLRRVP